MGRAPRDIQKVFGTQKIVTVLNWLMAIHQFVRLILVVNFVTGTLPRVGTLSPPILEIAHSY